MRQKKIAIYGGAFNPPTNAHKEIIEGLEDRGFDEIWLLPSSSRDDKKITLSVTTRIRLLEIFIYSLSNRTKLILKTDELNSSEKTETQRTLKKLFKDYSQVNFSYVIGEDSLQTLPEWHDSEWLLKNVSWIVVPRPGSKKPKVLPDNFLFVKRPESVVSSTDVRERVLSEKSIASYVGEETEKFIMAKGLYKSWKN